MSRKTDRQAIASFCEWRKEWQRKRAQYLLEGNDQGVQRAAGYIEQMTQTIRELQQPPYMSRRPK